MANELIFDSSAKKTAIFLATIHHPKWPYQGTSAKLRQGSQTNSNLPDAIMFLLGEVLGR